MPIIGVEGTVSDPSPDRPGRDGVRGPPKCIGDAIAGKPPCEGENEAVTDVGWRGETIGECRAFFDWTLS